jgi:hypothetical protein
MPVEEEKHGRPRAIVTPHWPHAALAGVHHGEAAWENSFDDPFPALHRDRPATWRWMDPSISFGIVPCPLDQTMICPSLCAVYN